MNPCAYVPWLLALLWVAACGGGSNGRCADCGSEDGSAPSARDAGLEDAAPSDGSALDAAVAEADAQSDGSVSEDDAAANPDASQLDAEWIECRIAADCVLPSSLLACDRCQDGGSACPEVHCMEGFCATLMAEPCAERRPSESCTRDSDCPRPECKLLCQGDGRSACLPSRCLGGSCIPAHATCGLSLEPCPEGNRAGRECGACQEDGGCGFQVIGCFEACDGSGVCPGGEPCVDGLCQLTSCMAP